MKLFNKISALALAAAMTVGLAACGSQTEQSGSVIVDENGQVSLSGNTINVSGRAAKASTKVTPEEVYTLTVRGVDKDDMPIGGFLGPTDYYRGNGYKLDSLITDDVFKKLADCGLNYVIDTKNSAIGDYGETLLDLADRHGISWYMRYDDIMSLDNVNTLKVETAENMAEALRPLLSHERFAGLYGRDEPSEIYFQYIKQALSNFREAMAILGNEAKDLGVYVNLFPQVGGTQLSGTDKPITYQQYLDGFYDCDPFFLEFDSYPITGLENTVAGGWLNYLGTMNRSAKANGVAWQGFAQAGGNFSDVPGAHRITNENELNYDVNTMLAFGAKGINYFPCCFPPEWVIYTTEENTNDNSLINKYGTTTPTYYYAQKINNNIKAMAPYLMNSAHMGVILNGDGVCAYSASAPDKLDSFRQLKSVGGDPSLVGCFDYKGGSAFVVVNNTLTEHRGEIRLDFDDNYEYTVIQRGTTNNVIAESFVLTLEAGECALVVVK